MKKYLFIILSALLCFSMISCSNKNNYSADDDNVNKDSSVVEPVELISTATIVKNDDSTASMTAAELIETFNNNQDHFNKYYTGASISFSGVIKSIMKHQMTMINDGTWEVDNTVVIFEDGFCLVNPPQDLTEFSAGDSIDVSGSIITATTHMMLTVHGPTKSDPTVWIDGSASGIITTVKENPVKIDTLTASEFIDLFNNNQDRFNKYCTGKTITRTATVSSISKEQMTMNSDTTWETGNTVIVFDDGFCLVNPPQDIADIMPGDSVKFSGDIITATTHMMLEVHGPTKSNPTVWVDGSELGIIS